MAQFLRPDSNVTQTNLHATLGNSYTGIDEETASNADGVLSDGLSNGEAAQFECGLSNPASTPNAGTTTVRYRVGKTTTAGSPSSDGRTVTITCSVYEGTTLVAADTARTTGAVPTDYSFTPDMSGVGDWNNLRLRFDYAGSGTGGSTNDRCGAVFWAELEAPDGSSTQDLTPSLVTNSQTFFAPTVAASNALAPSPHTNSQSFFAPTVAPGAVDLSPNLLSDGDTIYAPTAAAGAVNLAPSLLTDGDTLYGPTVAAGAVALSPPLLSNAQSFPASTVTSSATIAPSLLTNNQSFYAATLEQGAAVQTLEPSLLTNVQSFYAPTISASYTLSPPLLDNSREAELVANGDASNGTANWTEGANTVYSAVGERHRVEAVGTANAYIKQGPIAVVAGRIYTFSVNALGGTSGGSAIRLGSSDLGTQYVNDLAASGAEEYTVTPTTSSLYITLLAISNSGAGDYVEFDDVSIRASPFFSPAVATVDIVAPSLFTNAQSFFAPTVEAGYTLAPSLLSNAQSFHAATVAAGAVGLSPSLLTNSQSFLSPTVEAGYILSPSLLTATQSFHAATITTGPVSLLPSPLTNEQTFHGATVDSSSALSPSLVDASAQIYAPSIEATYALFPPLVSEGQTFHASTVTTSISLLAPLLTNNQTFYAPSLVFDQVIAPPLIYASTDPSASTGAIVTVTRL